MATDSDDTAAQASMGDVRNRSSAVDAQVSAVLGRVMAQRRTVATAADYVRGRRPGRREVRKR
jgi:hypothetical protein